HTRFSRDWSSDVCSSDLSVPAFVHLRCHSEYSVVDGTVRIADYVGRARDDRMPALALTDLNNLFGAIKFYKAARGKGLKPLIGRSGAPRLGYEWCTPCGM